MEQRTGCECSVRKLMVSTFGEKRQLRNLCHSTVSLANRLADQRAHASLS